MVPEFVRYPLDVIRYEVGNAKNTVERPLRYFAAAAFELRFDEVPPGFGRDLFEKDRRAGLVKRAAGREHLGHDRRLRSGKHIADVALLLDFITQDTFDGLAAEHLNLLELIEADRHAETAVL